MITSLRSLASDRQRRRELRIRQLEQERDERVFALFRRIPELAVIKSVQTDIGLDLARLMLRQPTKFGKGFAELEAWSKQLTAERNALLQKHQIDPSELEVKWDCPDCKNTGWLPAEPVGNDTVLPPRKCHCLIQEEINELYRAAGITGPLRQQTFDRFDLTVYPPDDRDYMAKLRDHCRRFADRVATGAEVDSLLLMGDVGRGKTFLSSAVSNVVVAAKKPVVYFTFAEFLDLARLHRFDDDEEYKEGIQRLLDSDLIVLDDLGAEKVTEFVAQELFTIINHRMNRRLPMVVSTNLTPGELEDCYGPRIASRLLNGFDAMVLRGEDVRWVIKRRSAAR
jgi:DNA replication protein DnaC